MGCALETLHPSHINKPLKFFQRKLAEYRQQEQSFVNATSVNHGIIQSRIQNCPVQETTHDSRGSYTLHSLRYGVNGVDA